MILKTAEQLRDLQARSHRVAVVGASANPLRPSYFVFRYLRTHGFDVRPVTPTYDEVDGVKSFPDLAAYAAELGPPDIVDVFRNAAAAPQAAREAVAAKAKAIWFQYGVVNAEAIRIADEAGLDVVVDRCMKVEHARFSGGLTLTGMNSGVLSSKRRPLTR